MVMINNKKEPIPKGWKPLTQEIAKGRYRGSLKGMYYKETGDTDNPYNITYFEPPKEENPEVKIKPVGQEVVRRGTELSASFKSPEMRQITLTKRGGKFAVDYFDVNDKGDLIPKTEMFDTADEADSFVELRKKEGMFYGPSMTRRGVSESNTKVPTEVAKKVAEKTSYSQYRRLGPNK